MSILTIALDELDVVSNPRSHIETEGLDMLTTSIQEVGLLQPIVVTPAGDRYRVISGHRRLAAIEQLGWDEVDARVVEVTDESRLIAMAIAENTARENLDPFDEGQAYKALSERGLTYKEMAPLVGRSIGHISKMIRLLEVSDDVAAAVKAGTMSADNAYRTIRKPQKNPKRKRTKTVERRREESWVGTRPEDHFDELRRLLDQSRIFASNVSKTHPSEEVRDHAHRLSIGLKREAEAFGRYTKGDPLYCQICGDRKKNRKDGRHDCR